MFLRSRELYKTKKDCCGCGACYAICPRNAISMQKDDEGFYYPSIDSNLCIECNQCTNVCPIQKAQYFYFEEKI